MIFSHYRTIIFISKEKILWAKIKIPSGKIFGLVWALPWSEENLQTAFADIKKKFPRNVRVVVGEEFSYVTHFKKAGSENNLASEAQILIPENLQGAWDTREGDSGLVQVMAVQQKFFSTLEKIIFEAGLKVEAVETESIAISRMIPAEKNKAVLFARYEEKILLGVVQYGLVLATRIFFKLPDQKEVKEFLDYVSSQKSVSFESVYVQDKTGELTKIFQQFKLNVQEALLNPMLGICRKKDIRGDDKKVLNILMKNDEKAKR